MTALPTLSNLFYSESKLAMLAETHRNFEKFEFKLQLVP